MDKAAEIMEILKEAGKGKMVLETAKNLLRAGKELGSIAGKGVKNKAMAVAKKVSDQGAKGTVKAIAKSREAKEVAGAGAIIAAMKINEKRKNK